MPTEATLECTWPMQSWVQAGFKKSAWADRGRKSTMWTKQRLPGNACRTNPTVKPSHKHSQKLHETRTSELSAPACLITWDILLGTETHINLPLKKNFKKLKKKKERERKEQIQDQVWDWWQVSKAECLSTPVMVFEKYCPFSFPFYWFMRTLTGSIKLKIHMILPDQSGTKHI